MYIRMHACMKTRVYSLNKSNFMACCLGHNARNALLKPKIKNQDLVNK